MKYIANIIMAAVVLSLLLSVPVGAGTADVLASLSKQIDQSSDASAEVKAFAKDKLIPLCTNAMFVKAVTAQNAEGMSLADIKKIDEEWQAAEDILPIHDEMTTNDCAKEIQRIAESISEITETFVMDNQGANVGQNEITSDYWQGDEPKWQNSYNGGKGGVDISKPKLDKSTNRIDQKISLPIVNASGEVIGAVCFGIALK